jgi:hypothetical protein
MIAYKGFQKGLICRDYQFVMGLNVTEKANCAANGFHCAENPLDCLFYYPDMAQSEYYVVDAGGDIDEDGGDSKIACTELKVLKKLSLEDFLLHSVAYMADHPLREWNSHVSKNRVKAMGGYAIVRGIDPIAYGSKGDVLAFAKETPDGDKIIQVSVALIDGKNILPGVWYGADLIERKAC